jgi:hypothetical protein
MSCKPRCDDNDHCGECREAKEIEESRIRDDLCRELGHALVMFMTMGRENGPTGPQCKLAAHAALRYAEHLDLQPDNYKEVK